jgi:hypothetical protein
MINTHMPEIDWKYLRSIQAELLASLCKRINRKAMEILGSREMSERDKYKALYGHILDHKIKRARLARSTPS